MINFCAIGLKRILIYYEFVDTQVDFEQMWNANITPINRLVAVHTHQQLPVKIVEQHAMLEVGRCDGLQLTTLGLPTSLNT